MFTKHVQAVIQGMLDARKDLECSWDEVIVNPYDPNSESEQWDYWWEGYNAHRSPKIVS
jgi:hypothetical protein